MTRRAYPAPTEVQKAIKAARDAGLRVAAVDYYPGGRISIRIGEPLASSESTGDPALDAWLREGERDEAHRDH